MQVYISWSGQRSYKLALLLRDLIRKVTPGLDIWISAEDILDGARWSTDLIQILNEVNFCIVCVDPSNFHSPWLSYELGAIAKSIDKYNLRILYNELKPGSMKGPMSQFSPLMVDHREFRRLFEDLGATFPRLVIPRYDMIANLDQSWEDFDREVSEIPLEIITSDDEHAKDEPTTQVPGVFVGHVNETGQNMIALISVNDGIEDDRIATTMYLNPNDTLRHLIDLENKGLIRSVLSFGIRRWFITELGRKFLPGVYQE